MKNALLRAYCGPFLFFVLSIGLITPLNWLGVANSQYVVFPLQTLACGAMVAVWWRHYHLGLPRGLVFTLAVGVLALAIWVSPQELFGFPHRNGDASSFNPTIFASGSPTYWGTLTLRFLRMVVVVPFVEEIFWRGFLLRYLIREDFENVPFGTFSWFSFALVTVGFTLEHQPVDYAAAFVTGALFNWVAIRTRSLSSCILAHAVTNLLLGIYIMATRQWGFW